MGKTPELQTRPLTDREQRFVAEFLIDGNASAAYVRAGYSPRGANAGAARLSAKVSIRAAIDAGQKPILTQLKLNGDNALREMCLIAFADIGEIVDTRTWTIRENIPDGIRKALASIKVTTTKKAGTCVEFKLADKLGALDKLFRHLGLYRDKPDFAPPAAEAATAQAVASGALAGKTVKQLDAIVGVIDEVLAARAARETSAV